MDKLLKLSSELKDKVVVDTNLLLDDSKILFKLATKYKYLILPITVLKELDKHKFKPNTSYSAREAIRAIIEFKNKYKDRICFDIEECAGTFNNDQLIIASAKRNSATLATKDMSMSIIAEAQDVDIKLYDEVPNGIFNPYIYIEQTKLFKYNVKEAFAFNKNYCNKDYYDTVKIFSSVSNKDLDIETWFFIFIDTNEKNPIIYANNPFEYTLTRIDNDPKYREMNIDQHTKMKMLDSYQTCALYIMLKAPNSLITGSFGTGKSLLSTAFSLANDEGKTFITRPNLTVDSRFKVGFLPGDIRDKLSQWQAGIISSLYCLFSNTKSQKSNKFNGGDSYDFIRDSVFKQNFEMLSLESIQGISFMKNDLVLLDEAQLCSISILSTILSRFGKGSKLIITGDIAQTYGVISPAESGLLKLLRLLPNKYIAYVKLKINYRSELLELAAQLQNKIII